MRYLFVFTYLFMAFSPVYAQEQRFLAGIIGGMNAAQIDGDQLAGYHKPGILLGLRGAVVLSARRQVSIELLFSQKGSQSQLVVDNATPQFKMNLNYAEIPVQIHFLDWKKEDDEGVFYKMHFNIGASFARLVSASVRDDLNLYRNLNSVLNKNDFGALAGFTFFPNRKWGFGARFQQSINLLNDGNNTVIPQKMRGKLLGFYVSYEL
jgi:Outer membrane protein beta-barrel domain